MAYHCGGIWRKCLLEPHAEHCSTNLWSDFATNRSYFPPFPYRLKCHFYHHDINGKCYCTSRYNTCCCSEWNCFRLYGVLSSNRQRRMRCHCNCTRHHTCTIHRKLCVTRKNIEPSILSILIRNGSRRQNQTARDFGVMNITVSPDCFDDWLNSNPCQASLSLKLRAPPHTHPLP